MKFVSYFVFVSLCELCLRFEVCVSLFMRVCEFGL